MPASMARHSSTVTDARVSNAMSSACPAIMSWVAVDQAAGGEHPLRGRLLEQHLESQGGQSVAGDDGGPDAELAPHRRAMPALVVAVDDVVVDEREVVDQLDRDGARHADGLGAAASRSGRRQASAAPDALAAARQVVVHRAPAGTG